MEAGGLGIEPRVTAPKAVVLPLNYPPISTKAIWVREWPLMLVPDTPVPVPKHWPLDYT